MITAVKLEQIVKTGTLHSLYRETGDWYHHLKEFPGTLFDKDGFIIFRTEADYANNLHLKHRRDLNVPKGIATIPGYQLFSAKQRASIATLT